MFFQIHKDGLPVDGGSYLNVEEAFAALESTAKGGEVVEVDARDRIVHRYTLKECRLTTRRIRRETAV
jgi:hypothetical protein